MQCKKLYSAGRWREKISDYTNEKYIMRKALGLVFIWLLFSATSLLAADDIQFVSPEELRESLGAENLSILDARSERGWSNSEFRIPGAIRVTWDNVDEWSSILPRGNKLILYCS